MEKSNQEKQTFTYRLADNRLFTRNEENFINELSIEQVNTLKNVSLLDIFLSKHHYIEPHYHKETTELIYCVNGGAKITLLHPTEKVLVPYTIEKGEVVNVPQGWWHFIEALESETHLLAIFNGPKPELVLGSDILRLTPASVIADCYCINQTEWEQLTKNIPPAVTIAPIKPCKRQDEKPPQYVEPIPYQWNPYQQYTHPNQRPTY